MEGNWHQRMRIITESSEILSQTIAGEIVPPTFTGRGKLKVAVSGTDPTGTVSITGLDGSEVVSDELLFSLARSYITDYFYTSITSLICSGLTGLITIFLVDGANHDINIETESKPHGCIFRPVSQSSRLYETFGVVDTTLYYLRCSSKAGLEDTSKFRVIGFTDEFRVCRKIRELFVPGTGISREVETYALPA